jgi:hypothetical protein
MGSKRFILGNLLQTERCDGLLAGLADIFMAGYPGLNSFGQDLVEANVEA